MREFMRTAPGGGAWVDDICDKLMLELTATHLEDLTLKYGAKNANVCELKNGGVQLNVNWQGNGWACHTDENFTAAINQMWRQINMINRQREEDQNVI